MSMGSPNGVPNIDLYVEYIQNGAVSEADKAKLVSVLSQMIYGILPSCAPQPENIDTLLPIDLVEDVNELGNGLKTLIGGFESSKIPTLHIPSMIDSYNRLANRLGIAKLAFPEVSGGQSIGALIVTGDNGFLPSEIEVSLSSGDVVILPTKGGNLSEFNYNELIEILRYLMSIRGTDARFNSLTTQVTQELAIKTRTKNTTY